MTSKLGFSVVAPINVINPLSTCGKNASCWALLNRWISSTNRIVLSPRFQFWRACSITCSTSFFPLVTADNSMNSAFTSRAIIRANVVFPVPGGPHNIKLTGSPFLTIRLNNSPSPSKWLCPITSSSVCGLICSASGCLISLILPLYREIHKAKKSSTVYTFLTQNATIDLYK